MPDRDVKATGSHRAEKPSKTPDRKMPRRGNALGHDLCSKAKPFKRFSKSVENRSNPFYKFSNSLGEVPALFKPASKVAFRSSTARNNATSKDVN